MASPLSLHTPSTEVSEAQKYAQLYCWCWALNSDSHICLSSTFPWLPGDFFEVDLIRCGDFGWAQLIRGKWCSDFGFKAWNLSFGLDLHTSKIENWTSALVKFSSFSAGSSSVDLAPPSSHAKHLNLTGTPRPLVDCQRLGTFSSRGIWAWLVFLLVCFSL